MATLEERMEKLKADTEEKNSFKYLGEYNVGLARILGAPVDLANIPLSMVSLGSPEPVGGSASIQRLFSKFDAAPAPGEEGQDFPSRFAQEVGAVTLPFLGLLKKGKALIDVAAPAKTIIQKSAIKTAEKPLVAAAVETVASAGAAGGGIAAEKMFDSDEPWVRMLGELTGGLTASVIAGAPLIKASKTVANKARDTFRGKGAEQRATRRIAHVAEDVEVAQRRLEAPDEFGTPAGPATGDEGIIQLTKAVTQENPALAAVVKRQFAVAAKKARAALMESGDPDAARGYLDSRLKQASAAAHERILAMKGKGSTRAASKIVRQEIEKALMEANAVEAEKWGRINKGATASLESTQGSFIKELADRTVADDPEDIPKFLYDLIGNHNKKGEWVPGKLLSRPITVKEADALRKRLSAAARAERAKDAPNRNKIRILSEVKASVLDDVDATATGDDVREAIAYSRNKAERFSQGEIGDLLGYEKAGGQSFDAAETMERLTRSSGETQAKAFRQLLEAAPASREPAINYLKSSFIEQAADPDTGIVRPADAKRFMKKNRGLLKELPELKAQMEESVRSQKVVDEMLGSRVAVEGSAVQKQRSAVSLYLDSTPGKEFEKIFNSRNPAGSMDGLVAQVATDSTGNATKGLKSSLGRWLLKKSEIAAEDATGATVVSGKKFQKFINDNIDGISRLLSKEEIARLRQIGNEFAIAERFMAAGPATGGVISDAPSKVIDLFTGTALARVGAWAGKGTSGASLRTASIASREGKEILKGLTNDKARELIIGAVTDRKLLADLMTDITKVTPEKAEKIFGRVRAWMASSATSGTAPESDPQRITQTEDQNDIEKRMKKLQESLGEQ